MEKTIKVKSILKGLLIAFCIFILVDIIPFVILWIADSATSTANQIAIQKWAVKTSVFNFQKVYTRNSILPLLVLSEDYGTAIEYYKELEDLQGTDNLNTELIIYSYIRTGDYDNALMYASLINDKSRMAQIYLIKKDYEKADIVTKDLLSEKSIKASSYLYKSEILYHNGDYQQAYDYVDKALNLSPNFVDALYLKARICNNMGKSAEAKKYYSMAKYLDIERDKTRE